MNFAVRFAGADAGEEAAMLPQVIGRFRRVEDDRGVEEGEEYDQADIGQHIERTAMAEIGRDRREDAL